MHGKCWFYEDALRDLLVEARRWWLRETGGALLGWREGSEYVVDRVLGPGPDAKHGFSSFEPDGSWQVEQGRNTYYESGRTVAYVGEWHTHPRGGAQPSFQDVATAREIAEDESFRAPFPLSAIAVRTGLLARRSGWRLVVFVWNGESLEPLNLNLISRAAS